MARISNKNARLQNVVRGLKTLVKQTVSGAKQTVNPWGIPTFELNGPLCYFIVGKNHVTFGFHRGTSLQDPHGLTKGTGKNLRHVKVRTVEDLDRDGLLELVRAAARLNRDSPLLAMRPKTRVLR